MTDAEVHRADDGRVEPRHRGPAVPDGEITVAQAIRNIATAHGSRIYLFILAVIVLLMRLAYDALVEDKLLVAVGSAALGAIVIALFIIDSAEFRCVRRNPWARWGVRAWWLLFPALVAFEWLA